MKTKASGVLTIVVLLVAVYLLTEVVMSPQASSAMHLHRAIGLSDTISATVELNNGIDFIGAGAGKTIGITGVITATSINGSISNMKIRLVSGAACEGGRITDSIGYLDRFAWLSYNKEVELPYLVLLGFQRMVAVVQLRDVTNEVSDLYCDVIVVEGHIPIEPTSEPTPTITFTPSVEIDPVVFLPMLGGGGD